MIDNNLIRFKQAIITRKKNVVFFVLFIILLAALGFFYLSSNIGKPISISGSSNLTAVPTSYPFEEMTVPYLRRKTYDGVLSGDRQLVQKNSEYSSYLTNYTSEGLKINALMTIPAGIMPDGGWPAIVFIHGYIPPTLYETNGQSYSAYVDYLARNGFVVFKIDLRGHGNSEGEPGGGYFGSDYVTDALNAYHAMQNADFVNPKDVGLWGHSMAGNIVMRSAAVKKDIPALVIWAGAVYTYEDQRKYGINDNSYRPPSSQMQQRNRRQQLYEKYGSPSAKNTFWNQVAPTNYLNDLTGAIEIHHAIDDAVVNIGYSRDLMSLFDKTKVEHKLYEYPSGGHNISGPSFNLAMERTVNFFKSHLSN